MKTRLLLLLIALVMTQTNLKAAYFNNLPYTIHQPDNETINCFVSGDEFYNWIHDQEGYTIIQAPDGYYYYGYADDQTIKPSKYKVNKANPVEVGLVKWAKIPESAYKSRRIAFEEAAGGNPARAASTGALNNIVVYIRFSDDTEFTNTRQFFDDKFNLVSGTSLKSYYSEVSYTQLTINSTNYPECPMTTNLSYQDTHPRAYFQPYNATTNPTGYDDENERTIREHTLLQDAINWINVNSPVPANLNIDNDNDGNVDNVCFNVRGSNGAWSSLLWAHSWTLFSYNVYINGKRVWKYTFQPETQLDVKTLCHEMFHTLGAPDLYHYASNGIQPAQNWDLMEQGFGHMSAYMKWKYSNNTWITSIPEITASGTYSLNPLASSSNNCYKIKSPNSLTEFFVIEYRKATGPYETNLPGSGLLVYRINPAYYGNAYGPPDEVYIYRPNGTLTANGSPSSAFFSSASGRTFINDTTNPACFLQSGNAGGLNISNISSAGTTISFTVTINSVEEPTDFSASAVGTSEIDLDWLKNSNNNNVMLAVSPTPVFGNPVTGASYCVGSSIPGGGTVIYAGASTAFVHSGLNTSTTYYYKLWSVADGNLYSFGSTQNATTFCNNSTLPYTQDFPTPDLPTCWSTQQSANAINKWVISNSSFAGGTGYEMKSTYQSANPGVSRLVLLPINTLGMTQLNLSFNTTLDDYAPGATMRVQSSADGVNWTNEAWMLATASNSNIGPEIVNTTVTNNLNSEFTYIAFTIEGDLFQYDYWYIDNVSVTNAGNQSFVITTAADPVSAGTLSGAGTYFTGQNVTLVATPGSGWNFLNWTENGTIVSLMSTYSFSASANRDLVAHFSMNQISISTSASPVAGGNVNGGGTYQVSMPVTLLATPNEGYQFVSWTEDGNIVSTDPVYSFTAEVSRNLVANFEVLQFTINTVSVPESGGSTYGGGTFTYHALVTVVATPNQDWLFAGWYENGAFVSANATYSFQAAMSRNLEAYFTLASYNILLSANPEYGGSVAGQGAYSLGCTVTASAVPAVNWVFISWTESGAVVSTESNYTFTATSDRTLIATFLPLYEISTSDLPTIGGYTTGSGLYVAGDTVTLSAFASEGYTFLNWTENRSEVSTDENYQFVATANRTLEANFLSTVGIVETAQTTAAIYPNPTRGLVHITTSQSFNHPELTKVEVYNSVGEQVKYFLNVTNKTSMDIDLKGLESGMYSIRLIFSNTNIITSKVLLLKN
jgi:M6 family metalloprotease-like protein